jgi:Uma2 family endonuclease
MATMTVSYASVIKKSIDHLPLGGTMIVPDVTWENYQQLVEELDHQNGVRLTFDKGSLEIISPLPIHEKYKEFLIRLMDRLSILMNFDLESLGSTTFNQEWLNNGVEPDTCFYIQNASKVIGKDRIDLAVDPPPDIAVEVDISHHSTTKLKIYEELKVPEIWLYDNLNLKIFILGENGYIASSSSSSFPFLTSEALTRFLEQSKTQGQGAALQSFLEWVKTKL